MNIIVTLDSREVLDRIDKEDIREYVLEKWNMEDLEQLSWGNKTIDEIWDILVSSTDDIEGVVADKVPVRALLREIPEEDIVQYLTENTENFVGSDVGELMEQVYNAGLIGDVIDMFQVRYSR